ncbi:hypothetical protein N2152v2_004381 [Parachlorella kessleri]
MAGAASTDPQRLGDIGGSLESFDAALAVRPSLRPYLWQRGLSLYYLQQYEEAAQQFRDDVAVNPADTEESIWCFLSEAQLRGPDKARESFLQAVMRAAYKCFKDGSDPSAIVEAAAGDTVGHAAFYAWLYVGLWHEAQGDADAAQAAIGRAVQTDYARGSGDYMAALARVHLHQRGWA